MVHVFCLDEKCRRAIHLSEKHWNFKGKIKCQNCGAEFEVEIENGKLVSSKKSEEK